MNQSVHTSVLLSEVVELLEPRSPCRILDCTVGLGGHSLALLEKAGPEGSLVALDADAENLSQAEKYLSSYSNQCTFLHTNFARLSELDLGMFDIILADLGISSPHIDDPEKGFSFREDGPLDMRFDRTAGVTAAELIAQSSEEELANILYQYGEIRQSRKLSSALKEALPKTTFAAKDVVNSVAGSLLPLTFQALRIAVNDELGALRTLLDTAPVMLNSGGCFGVISFHSLEDRLVKEEFRRLSTPNVDDVTGAPLEEAKYTLRTKGAVKATEEEVEQNPRARSARLRVIEKV